MTAARPDPDLRARLLRFLERGDDYVAIAGITLTDVGGARQLAADVTLNLPAMRIEGLIALADATLSRILSVSGSCDCGGCRSLHGRTAMAARLLCDEFKPDA